MKKDYRTKPIDVKAKYIVLISALGVLSFLFINGLRSGDETSATTNTKQRRKVFVDLGANCGNTYLQHRIENEDDADEWEAYLWEPSPQMHKFYLDDLRMKYPRINILPFAGGVENGELELYIHKGQENVVDKSQFQNGGKCRPGGGTNPSGATSVFNYGMTGDSVTVKVMSIPDWLKNLQLTDEDTFIFKIDIEGAEYAILDALLSDEDDNSLCLVDLFKIEFHPKQVRKIGALDNKYETFGDDFPRMFKEKCGRDAEVEQLFWRAWMKEVKRLSTKYPL